MNDQLSDKILKRIETDKITPLPHWRFLLWRLFFWLFAVLSIALGSLAIGVMLFLGDDQRRHGFFTVSHQTKELLVVIPFLWIVALALFIVIARISIAHTKKGYRYSLHSILFVSIILSFILGSIFYFVGIGKETHEFLNQRPIYNAAVYDSEDLWDQVAVGRLAGVVVSINDNSDFSLADFSGHIWQVHLTGSSVSAVDIELNSTVRLIGVLGTSSSTFIASSVFEWEN